MCAFWRRQFQKVEFLSKVVKVHAMEYRSRVQSSDLEFGRNLDGTVTRLFDQCVEYNGVI